MNNKSIYKKLPLFKNIEVSNLRLIEAIYISVLSADYGKLNCCFDNIRTFITIKIRIVKKRIENCSIKTKVGMSFD